ncbi:hypothetical protein V5799_023101 [Amblyomma americanum]|uniref:Uncharacterized protein n=1 Tax=Amblyomma americanum TaxID=6943 RepID=A0AAQ4FII8_AMBAM
MRILGTEHRILQWNQPCEKYGDSRKVQIFQASLGAPNSSSSDVPGTSRTGFSTFQGVAPGEGSTNEEQEAPCPRRSREEAGMATEKYHRWKPAYFSNETWRKLPDDLKKRYGNVNKDGSMKERKEP